MTPARLIAAALCLAVVVALGCLAVAHVVAGGVAVYGGPG